MDGGRKRSGRRGGKRPGARSKGHPRSASVEGRTADSAAAAPKRSRRREGPRPLATFALGTPAADALAQLLRERTGGQVNVRGILFQLLYAATRAAELPAASAAVETDSRPTPSVRFEGIEDVDVQQGEAELALRPLAVAGAPIQTEGEDGARGPADAPAAAEVPAPPVADSPTALGPLELVQLKSSDQGWGWARLKPIIANFLEALRSGHPPLTFRLVINFAPRGDVADLAIRRALPPGRARRIAKRFRTLCTDVGGTTEEADSLLERLDIEVLSDAEARARFRRSVAAAFSLADTRALDAHETALLGQALTWARERSLVTLADVLAVGRCLAEGLARQSHFEAFGRHWVGEPSYAPDAAPDDFLDARGARFGHVVLGLDVPRPVWLARINAALQRASVCVLRAPSGQGKSTLAQRYTVEHWSAESVVVVRVLDTEEHAEAVGDYLTFRAGLGLPVRVLIDGGPRTRRWPAVAARCAELGLPTLVTVRTEDWHRYAVESLTRFEVLEPVLDEDEAHGIFAALRGAGRVHPSVDAAAYALDRIGEPRLLLEFVYFLTHGRMLEERLRDQLRSMRADPAEDPAKLEILRRAVVADAFGAPLPLDQLLDAVPPQRDPQATVGSLLGEYLVLEDGRLRGLHWVRSEHLARLLHDGGVPSATRTALATVPLVLRDDLAAFVAGAAGWPDVDEDGFLDGLAERFGAGASDSLLAVIDGLFEAGERRFFAANRALFEEAFQTVGASGPWLLGLEISPVLRMGVLTRLVDLFEKVPADEPAGMPAVISAADTADSAASTGAPAIGSAASSNPESKSDALRRLARQIVPAPRGLDMVRALLTRVARLRPAVALWDIPADARLLMWCALAQVAFPAWPAAREAAIVGPTHWDLPPEQLADAALALARYDPGAYERWYTAHETDLLAFLSVATRAVSLRVVRDAGPLGDAMSDSPLADPAPTAAAAAQATDASVLPSPEGDEEASGSEDDVRPRVELRYLLSDVHDDGSAASSSPGSSGSATIERPVAGTVDAPIAAISPGQSANDQSVARLELVRRAIPFARRYDANGERFLPQALVSAIPHDDATKRMPREYLPAPNDVALNVVWGAVVGEAFWPDSAYRLLQRWHRARAATLRAYSALHRLSLCVLGGRTAGIARVTKEIYLARDEAIRAHLELPSASAVELARVGARVSIAVRRLLTDRAAQHWSRSSTGFLQQVVGAIAARYETSGAATVPTRDGERPSQPRLALHNLDDSADHLAGLHAAFAEVFRDTPDYHGSRGLEADERRMAEDLPLLIDGWLVDPIRTPDAHPLQTLRDRERRREEARLRLIAEALQVADASGVATVQPVATRRIDGLRETAIGVALPHAGALAAPEAFPTVAIALTSAYRAADRFWIVPLLNGARLGRRAHVIYGHDLQEDGVLGRMARDEPVTEAELSRIRLLLFGPQELAPGVEDLLPPLPVIEPPAPGLDELLPALHLTGESYAQRVAAVCLMNDATAHPLRARQRAILVESLAVARREIEPLVVAARHRLGAAAGAISSAAGGVRMDPSGEPTEDFDLDLLRAAEAHASEFLGSVDSLLDACEPGDAFGAQSWPDSWDTDVLVQAGDILHRWLAGRQPEPGELPG